MLSLSLSLGRKGVLSGLDYGQTAFLCCSDNSHMIAASQLIQSYGSRIILQLSWRQAWVRAGEVFVSREVTASLRVLGMS